MCSPFCTANASNYNFIIMLGFQLGGCSVACAEESPDTNFVLVDDCQGTVPNLICALFREEQPAFVAGYMSGLVSQTKVLGVIGGAPFPPVQKFYNGFQLGVKRACPECIVEGTYVYGFDNGQDGGTKYARYLVEQKNVDVLFGCGGGTGTAAILLGAELGVHVVGVDVDEWKTAAFQAASPEVRARIITSAQKKVDTAVFLSEEMFRKGMPADQSRRLFLDFGNDGVSVSPCHESCASLPPTINDQVKALEAQLSLQQVQIELSGVGAIDPFGANAETNTWYEIAPFSGTPRARGQFSVAAYTDAFGLKPGHLVLYGGLDTATNEPLGELLVFDSTSQMWVLSEPLDVGTPPPALTEACVAVLGGGADKTAVFILGGQDSDNVRNEEIYTWTPMSSAYFYPLQNTWATVVSSGASPGGRTSPSCTAGGVDELLLFGGRKGTTAGSDTWIFDRAASTWAEIAVESRPPPRWSAGSAFGALAGENVLVIAGGAPSPQKPEGMGDVWALSIDAKSWRELAPLPHALRFAPIVGFVDIGEASPILMVWPVETLAAFELDGRKFSEGMYALAYDPQKDSWAAQDQGGVSREGSAGVLVGDRVWTLGGSNSMAVRGSVFRLQPVCEAGSFFDGRRCTLCPVGTFSQAEGYTACLQCGPGQFAASEGAVQCQPCAAGSEQPRHGASACDPCAAGKFADQAGMASCADCGLGTYSTGGADGAGAERCARCELGWFQDLPGQTGCSPCRASETTPYQGAESEDACGCEPGMYAQLGARSCVACGDGLRCDGHAARPMLEPGFHSAPVREAVTDGRIGFALDAVYRCTHEKFCPGGEPATCAAGRERSAIACGRCEDKWAQTSDGMCEYCEGGEWAAGAVVLLIFILLVVVVITLFVLKANPKRLNVDVLHAGVLIGLGFTSLQTLQVYQQMEFDWDKPFADMLRALSFLTFDLRLVNIGCLAGTDSAVRYTGTVMCFPILLALFTSCWGLAKVISKDKVPLHALTNGLGIISITLYISLAAIGTRPFVCLPHPPDADGTVRESVTAYPDIICGEGDHCTLAGVGGLALFICAVVLGTCCALVHLYSRARRARNRAFMENNRFLFTRFQPDQYYFGLAMLARNTVLSICPIFSRGVFAVFV